jgi:hypothetical protein
MSSSARSNRSDQNDTSSNTDRADVGSETSRHIELLSVSGDACASIARSNGRSQTAQGRCRCSQCARTWRDRLVSRSRLPNSRVGVGFSSWWLRRSVRRVAPLDAVPAVRANPERTERETSPARSIAAAQDAPFVVVPVHHARASFRASSSRCVSRIRSCAPAFGIAQLIWLTMLAARSAAV